MGLGGRTSERLGISQVEQGTFLGLRMSRTRSGHPECSTGRPHAQSRSGAATRASLRIPQRPATSSTLLGEQTVHGANYTPASGWDATGQGKQIIWGGSAPRAETATYEHRFQRVQK